MRRTRRMLRNRFKVLALAFALAATVFAPAAAGTPKGMYSAELEAEQALIIGNRTQGGVTPANLSRSYVSPGWVAPATSPSVSRRLEAVGVAAAGLGTALVLGAMGAAAVLATRNRARLSHS